MVYAAKWSFIILQKPSGSITYMSWHNECSNTFIHTQDSCSFVVSNGSTQTFHLKASSEVERQRWVTALELAKAKAITLMESDEEEELIQPDKNEISNVIRVLDTKLDDLKTCNDLIVKHSSALQKALIEMEQVDNPSDVIAKTKSVNERATLFRITSNAMISACADFVTLVQTQGTRWKKLMQYDHEQRLYLEEMVEQLGRQHSCLEKQIRKSLIPVIGNSAGLPTGQGDVDGATIDEEEDDFYDALDENEEQKFEIKVNTVTVETKVDEGKTADSSIVESGDARKMSADVDQKQKFKDVSLLPASSSSKTSRVRRKCIPEKPNISINLWSIMKNCIGKELSKIPMPVNFSEPLSFLQRLSEDFEYSSCLDKAALCTDSFEKLAYVAAFTVSSYANTTTRTGKPFNPLLGETYEFDRRDDLGWRSCAEQVSHHPPMVAMHTESRDWVSWQEFTMSSKFRGKYLQIIPLGIAHLLFPKTGDHYTWRKVTTTVHNIIVGRLWVDNHGDMEIVNHHNGDRCHLKYYAYSYFSREVPHKVTGLVTDDKGTAHYVLSGTWDDKIEGAKVLSTEEPTPGKIVYKTAEPVVLWQRNYPPPELEKCYNFTQLAVELNEMEDGVAPTDSRRRPDQRLMEEGQWDQANDVKVQLEEKQRAARRERDGLMEEAAKQGREYHGYEPVWFRKETDPQTGNVIHVYTGEYWECKQRQDWSRCPDIYV